MRDTEPARKSRSGAGSGRRGAALGKRVVLRFGRAALLLALALAGTVTLTRVAPGYFSDAAEMDAQYAGSVRARLADDRARAGSTLAAAAATLRGWVEGDLGRSRQFGLPVTTLLRPRVGVSASLLLRGLGLGWLLALAAAIPAAAVRSVRTPGERSFTRWRGPLFRLPFILLLAVPAGALATLCLATGTGGPVLVLAAVIASRDFFFLEPLFRDAWQAERMLLARAQGIRPDRMLWAHLLPAVTPQLLALAALSVVTALSAMLPIEVLFDVPGVEQFAWNATLNRDLPVLVAVTGLLAAVVALTGIVTAPGQDARAAELA